LRDIEDEPHAQFEASVTLPLCEQSSIAMLLTITEPMSPFAQVALNEVRKKFLAQLSAAHEMAKPAHKRAQRRI